MDATVTPAVEQVQEALGVTLSDETARRLAERIGAVAEAQTQAALTRARQGQPVWTEDEIARADDTRILVVEVDGVLVPQEAGWHEMTVGTLAPLGPALRLDPTHGRATLAGGSASYGVGGEDAEACWWRVYVEARRRGLGTPAVRTVVVLGDGARWIWDRARAFVGLPGVEVVEIVDLYHADGYLCAVGHALYGAGSLRAAAWVAPLKDHLYLHGVAPVLTALARLSPTTEEAVNAIADAQTDVTRNVARMDYPRVVARQLPIGSGAVESACKGRVEARLKQAGLRWGVPGSHAIASLRAVQRAGRWAAFWQTHPDRQPAAARPPPAPSGPPDSNCPGATSRRPGGTRRPRATSRRPRATSRRPRAPAACARRVWPPPPPRPVPARDRRPRNVRCSCPAPPRELCCGAPLTN